MNAAVLILGAVVLPLSSVACTAQQDLGNHTGDADSVAPNDAGQVGDAGVLGDRTGDAGDANSVAPNDAGQIGDAGDYVAKCKIACQLPNYRPCASQDPTPCVDACVAQASQFSSNCAKCLIRMTGWSGTYCDGNGSCSFSTFSSGTCAGTSKSQCTTAEETCTFQTGTPGGSCRSTCL